MNAIKRDFLAGFHEGWGSFWSPFSGLFRALSETWRQHLFAGALKRRSKKRRPA